MPKQFSCAQGHFWGLDPACPGAHLLGIACPECGSTAQTWPPSPSLDPATERDVLPRIPGYELLAWLGGGGMGVVYKARQIGPNRLVALKRMKPTDPQQEVEARQRFRLEAEAAARLRHPGIVEIYEVGEHEGCPYFSMELIENGSLDARLKSGPLPPRQAAELIERVARAVHAAHQAGIVHRDLKPANVLMARDAADSCDAPKITDFGLARMLDVEGPSQTGAVLGTPHYMAPEQVRGEGTITAAADVYSLGGVLYECLTGRPPFAARTVDLFVAVLDDEPVPVRQLQPRVERDLETICHKCLRKEPSRRYRSALEVAEELRRLLEGKPIEARPVGTAERAAKWVRRNPALAAMAALILVTLTAATVVSTLFALDARDQATEARWQKKNAEDNAALANEKAEGERKERVRADDEAKKAKKNEERAKAETYRANVALHVNRMNAASQAWQQNDLSRAEAILDEVTVEFRQTFEYRHLRGLCRRKGMPLRGHADEVWSVAYSPDGCRIVSGGADKTLKVWDATAGQELLTLEGHGGLVRAVAYGPDGSRVASGSDDGTSKVWDARTGQNLLTLAGHKLGVAAVAYSPDGTRLASGSLDGAVKVWDARTGQELLTLAGHADSVSAVAYSPDGARIVSGSWDKTLKAWDARSGRELLSLEGHTNNVSAVAYSPDGCYVVSGSWDHTLKVWDARTGQQLPSLEKGHSNGVRAVAYSPDGCRIVSGDLDGAVKVWDARTGQNLLTLEGHADSVSAVACSPDGIRVVSGSLDRTLRVWDARRGQELLTIEGHTDSVSAVTYSPDDSRIASRGSDGTRKVWDSRTGQNLLAIEEQVAPVLAEAYSRDGSRLASGSSDGTVKVWDARTGRQLLSLQGHRSSVRAVAFSPDDRRIVSGSADKTLKVWDASTGEPLFTLEGHRDAVNAVAYSRDGSRLASGSSDGTVKVWDARTGRQLLSLQGHRSSVRAVAFSPDGFRIVSGSSDKTLKLWDATVGQDLLTFEGHSSSVRAVAFSSDGCCLVSGSDDRTLKVWDATEGAELLPRGSHSIEAALRVNRDRQFHTAEAERRKRIDPPGAVFHLDRLLALSADERPAVLNRRFAILTAALKANPSDHDSARRLARQAVADFGTVGDPTALLSAIARHPHSALDRLHGALLLRTDNDRDAAIVLRAAVRHRQPGQPPIDELLLSIALSKLGRRDEARQHLETAAAWMDNGTAPQRLAAVLGARPAGPLAALGALAHVPDVRLNRLDPFTGHELYTLRREAEGLLRDEK